MQQKKLTNLQMILDFLQGAKRYFVAGVLLAWLSSLAQMLRPKIIQYTVDGVLAENAAAIPAFLTRLLAAQGGVEWIKTHLWIPAIAVVACSLAEVVLQYLHSLCVFHGGETFVKSMRDQLFGHLLGLSSQWHSSHQTGDIIQRCTSDIEEVKNFLSEQLLSLLRMIVTILLVLGFMLRIDLVMTGVALVGIPLFIAFSFRFHDNIGRTFRACDENEGVLSTIAQENLTGVRVVRAFGRERREQERFTAQNTVVTEAWVKLGVHLSTFFATADFLTNAMVMCMLCLGSYRCVAGSMTVGELLAILSYMAMLIRPVRGMGRVLSELSKTGVSINRLREIMEAPTEQDAPDADTPAMDGDITFDHVSFGYEGQPELLHDVSFTVPAGTTLGILGGTGSGKSTLMQLLARLYPLPEGSGTIAIGGRDIRTMKAAWVRRNVGYVLQEPFLFSRSIAENILLARPEVGMEGVRTASRAACLEEVVDGFPKGFDTFVGERGVTLSGGQKQRTAIARTLAMETPILVFDDSLSAVDAETDAAIRENLKRYMGKATVILISHRVTSLMAADNILVLEDGRVTQQGTHEQLAAREGLYKTICEIQQGKEDAHHAQ